MIFSPQIIAEWVAGAGSPTLGPLRIFHTKLQRNRGPFAVKKRAAFANFLEYKYPGLLIIDRIIQI